jgi:hypothetical protein
MYQLAAPLGQQNALHSQGFAEDKDLENGTT